MHGKDLRGAIMISVFFERIRRNSRSFCTRHVEGKGGAGKPKGQDWQHSTGSTGDFGDSGHKQSTQLCL